MAQFKNPFTPNFGSEPLVLAGRDDIINGMRRAFENGSGDPRLTSLFIGARGTGKTALLSFLPTIATEHGWITASTTALPGMLEDLYQRALAQTKHLSDPDSPQLTGLSIANVVGFEWKSPDEKAENWRTRMYAILDALDKHQAGLLFTVDEVGATLDEMITFAAVFQHFVREGRRVALLMAGLPGNVSRLLSTDAASFLRRSKQYRLLRISNADIARAMRKTIEDGGRSITEDALRVAVDASGGFPYMMQLVGFNMWEHAVAEQIDVADAQAGMSQAQRDMEAGVYRNNLNDLSDGDIAFLRAMLPDKEISRIADITQRMGVTSAYASQYRLRLIEQGIIGERGRGRLGFDIPGFDDFLRAQYEVGG